jgi:hypothetical protein
MSGAILNPDLKQGIIAGAMGAFVAETFADINQPDKPNDKIKALEKERGRRLTKEEHQELYAAELKAYGKKIKDTADWSKIVAATSLLLAQKDIQTGLHTATNALENNYLALAFWGVQMAAGLAWTAYDVTCEYQEHGAEAALQKLGIYIVVGAITGYCVGNIIYPTAGAALTAVIAKNPGLKHFLGKTLDKLIKSAPHPRLPTNMPKGSWKPPKEALDKVRQELGVGQITDKGQGIKFQNNHGQHCIRFNKGNPLKEHPTQQVDYVKITRNGQTIGRDGKIIEKTLEVPFPRKHKDAHIPLSEWLKWNGDLQP